MKKISLSDFQNRLDEIRYEEKLIALTYQNRLAEARVRCSLCGDIFNKKAAYYLDKRKVSICKKCFPTQSNTKKTLYNLPKGYEYVEKYNGMHSKILVKHSDCGFIWKITPSNLKQGKGCPKCSKKASKGERKIISFLTKQNIDFIFQHKVAIDGKNYFIDFFIPSMKLFIEYNGEQHYRPVDFFGGQPAFSRQQEVDKIKKDYCGDNLLVIPYWDFDNIEDILTGSTTIQKWSTSQAVGDGSEKHLIKDDDIVSSSSRDEAVEKTGEEVALFAEDN